MTTIPAGPTVAAFSRAPTLAVESFAARLACGQLVDGVVAVLFLLARKPV